MRRSAHLDDQLDLHRRVQRQRRHPDRGPGMRSGLAEHLAEQVRRAVDDGRLAGEVGAAGHVADDLDHPDDRVDADQGMHRGQRVQGAVRA